MSSWKIATVMGVPIRVHASVLVLLAVATALSRSLFVPAIAVGALFCIALHELGHTAVALAKGCRVRQIMLLPTGGAAMMEQIPEKPRDEFLMAIAGPAVSLLVGLMLALIHPVIPWAGVAGYLEILSYLNLLWVAFNLAPAFPMDGGRVLRALLTPRLGRLRATYIASRIGKLLAFCFGVWALMHNPTLWFYVAIAFLIYSAAEGEYRAVKSEEMIKQFGNPFGGLFSTFSQRVPKPNTGEMDQQSIWISPPPYEKKNDKGTRLRSSDDGRVNLFRRRKSAGESRT